MYTTAKYVNKLHNGSLSKCKDCDLVHLKFNNILFEFTMEEFNSFKRYLKEIDNDYHFSSKNSNETFHIPTAQQNLFLLFNEREIIELKRLVLDPPIKNYPKLNAYEINYLTFKN